MTTVELPEPRVREHGTTERAGLPFALGGSLGLLVAAGVVAVGVAMTVTGDRTVGIAVIVVGALLLIGFGILLGGVTIVAPGRRGCCCSSAGTRDPCARPGCGG
ncbi:hypothetical protein GCM10029964_011320 [Kibdelosporangium lantanae]